MAAGPSHAAEDIASDPHVRARDMLIEVPRPDAERSLLVVGNPVKLSRASEGPVRRFPRLGEHTRAVLAELGFETGVVEDLLRDGVIAE